MTDTEKLIQILSENPDLLPIALEIVSKLTQPTGDIPES